MVKTYGQSFRICKHDKSEAIFSRLFYGRLKEIKRNWYRNDLANLWCWQFSVPDRYWKYLFQTKYDFWRKLLIFQMPNTTLGFALINLSQYRSPLQEYFSTSCENSSLIAHSQYTQETLNLTHDTYTCDQW